MIYPIAMPQRSDGALPFVASTFDLRRFAAREITRGGVQRALEIAPAVWTMTATTSFRAGEDADAWLAWRDSLRGGRGTFFGYDSGKRFARAYPNGYQALNVNGASFSAGVGAYTVLSPGRDTVTATGLPNGFLITAGDMLAFAWTTNGIQRRSLHRCLTSTAAAANQAIVEIEPTVRGDVPQGAAVHWRQPACVMRLDPEQQPPARGINGAWTIQFSASEFVG